MQAQKVNLKALVTQLQDVQVRFNFFCLILQLSSW